MRYSRSKFLWVLTIFIIAQSEASYELTMIRNKVLHGCTLMTTTEKTVGNCLAKCLKNCFCRSFQKCDVDGPCSLCLGNYSSLTIKEKRGCSYFAIERKQSDVMSPRNCLQDANCCLTSEPCLNGGTCRPTIVSDALHSPRFTCDCPGGYLGNHCERPVKSCRGYINDENLPQAGLYTIIDDSNKPFKVFCDFVSRFDPKISWTLVQSFQRNNSKDFEKPFFEDSPISAETPNWSSYRLSKYRMRSIQGDSSKWRMTCQYETDGVNYTDYMQGLKSEVNIFSLNKSKCARVEFINVRGYECSESSDCKAFIRQKFNKPFHHDSYRSNEKCNFKPEASIACNDGKRGEDDFGFYKCINTAHRCSKNALSTTQAWLGGI